MSDTISTTVSFRNVEKNFREVGTSFLNRKWNDKAQRTTRYIQEKSADGKGH